MALIATPGAVDANSYATLAEAQAYFDTRLPLAGWESGADQEALLIMATRVMDAFARPLRVLVIPKGDCAPYYRIRRQWTGAPTTTTQRLAWPRTGVYSRNGALLDSTTIPLELIEATAELAGQLGAGDRTIDNDVSVQGLTSVKAGSVALTFKDMIERRVMPDIVWDLLIPSWLTEEIIEPAYQGGLFDVVPL